jgi:hypothetical protein
MAKYKDEEGNEVEALTPEEVEAKLAAEKAAIEDAHKNVVTEKDTAIETLAKEKAELEEKIRKAEVSGIKEDHPNFKILKDALAKKDEDIKGLKTEIDTDKATRKQEALDTAIKIATKGNVELEKKVKLHMEKTLGAMADSTTEERQAKIQAALTLSGDYGSAGMFDGGIGGGGAGNGGNEDTSGVEFTAREKALGAKLGISQDDYKKYGARLNKK